MSKSDRLAIVLNTHARAIAIHMSVHSDGPGSTVEVDASLNDLIARYEAAEAKFMEAVAEEQQVPA